MVIDTTVPATMDLAIVAADHLPADMSFEDWSAFGVRLHRAQEHLNWIAGDWLKDGIERFGDVAIEALKAIVGEETGKGASALKQALWMAETYRPDTRVPEVSYTAHRAAASLPEEDRRPILEAARDEGLTTRQVQDRVRERKAPAPIAQPVEAVIVDVVPQIVEPEIIAAPADQAEAWLLIADLAAFIRDRVMIRKVVVDGVETRHERHCTATADRLVCPPLCVEVRALITRAELG